MRARSSLTGILTVILFFAVGYYCTLLMLKFRGVFLIACGGASLVFWALSFRRLVLLMQDKPGYRWILDRLCLISGGIFLSLVFFEVMLQIAAGENSARKAVKVIPKEWQRSDVTIPGSVKSYYWHGKLHVHDAYGFRTTAPYTYEPGKLRIAIIGDSGTYGYGVAAEEAYPALVEKEFAKRIPVRVYNLGRSGAQSEDYVKMARKWIPKLKPNVVVCGIFLNDFLRSGVHDYGNNMRYKFDFLPPAMRAAMINHSLLGATCARGYNQMLMKAGMRQGFYDEILSGMMDHQKRFRQDMAELNRYVNEQTGSTLIVIVINHSPDSDIAKGVSAIAERIAREEGIVVVPTEDYYRTHNKVMKVSDWETHASAEAHSLFAAMLLKTLKEHPSLRSK